ncbi:cobalt-precorrin-6A reductase [Trinickia dinghuensis]|uniref:Cobalt-precorrin-6A reductase n=1 Tax=Trinickia dinghuensis TaxID=2291023 RepID=A0A3D8JW84_9BURK|nr:cobalt-precorrin-6A reductase [Trinickia dinghuensis]RDU96641.1 cobalt-precorrin-6A reductase [Trinickia dinghuensis]
MTRVLLLGGTGDALKIARRLRADDVYSLAGLGKTPDDLACDVRVGGFGGSEGLARYVETERIGLIVDATHPYAARISANAATASRVAGVHCWALRRPPWQPQPGDDWRFVGGWDALVAELAGFNRPLFTLGRGPLSRLDEIPAHQYWTVRCLDVHPGNERSRIIGARGPFTLDGERALFEQCEFDVVISKNSGGAATEAKLEVARERGLPVIMLARPSLPEVPDIDRIFETTDALLNALETLRAQSGARTIRPAP